jgi:hypothetical protein
LNPKVRKRRALKVEAFEQQQRQEQQHKQQQDHFDTVLALSQSPYAILHLESSAAAAAAAAGGGKHNDGGQEHNTVNGLQQECHHHQQQQQQQEELKQQQQLLSKAIEAQTARTKQLKHVAKQLQADKEAHIDKVTDFNKYCVAKQAEHVAMLQELAAKQVVMSQELDAQKEQILSARIALPADVDLGVLRDTLNARWGCFDIVKKKKVVTVSKLRLQ